MLIDPYAGSWETRYSSRGFAYQVWQPRMPWIDPEFLECTIYLYPSEADAEDGNRIGGSGFLISIPIKDSKISVLCAVTNKHVIDSGNMVARINTVDGRKDIIPLDGMRWFSHPHGDDVTLCPIQLGAHHQVKCIPLHFFLTKSLIDDLEIGPGDEVFIVGRFVNHEGKQRNLPSVRFGNISQMPWEPILIDGYPQESFLVEARSISGYSGSPVFVYLPPAPMPTFGIWTKEGKKLLNEGKIQFPGVSKKRMNSFQMQLGPWLMGVDYCHIRWDEPILSRRTQKPINDDWFIKSNTGMMGVVPVWKLTDIIEGVEMKSLLDAAAEEAAKIAKKDSKVELDVANFSRSEPPTTADNPSHREDFNRLLGAAARKTKREDRT